MRIGYLLTYLLLSLTKAALTLLKCSKIHFYIYIHLYLTYSICMSICTPKLNQTQHGPPRIALSWDCHKGEKRFFLLRNASRIHRSVFHRNGSHFVKLSYAFFSVQFLSSSSFSTAHLAWVPHLLELGGSPLAPGFWQESRWAA